MSGNTKNTKMSAHMQTLQIQKHRPIVSEKITRETQGNCGNPKKKKKVKEKAKTRKRYPKEAVCLLTKSPQKM